ncbi:hypothetical protein [Mycobacterium sp. PS03-16]|uniref:hypothetical protein n=1 Tax=Mycobacterium sp. PS03-16 TaxID=2559611 RepID=UPI001430CDF6|nr:hypothetical protein [Mycobacterium sp. PS03-16]
MNATTSTPRRLVSRSAVFAAGLSLAIAWPLTACGDSGEGDTETTAPETSETTEPAETSENDGTIEIPSPSISIPSPSISVPELPDVTVSPAP